MGSGHTTGSMILSPQLILLLLILYVVLWLYLLSFTLTIIFANLANLLALLLFCSLFHLPLVIDFIILYVSFFSQPNVTVAVSFFAIYFIIILGLALLAAVVQ